MVKRKFRQNKEESDDEIESPRPQKQFKMLSKNINVNYHVTYSTDEELSRDSSDSDMESAPETTNSFNTGADNYSYDSFLSFMEANDFGSFKDETNRSLNVSSQNALDESEISVRKSVKRKSCNEVSARKLSLPKNKLKEELKENIRILSAPSELAQVVLLQYPASVTLHGYVKVKVWLGTVSIFGFEVKERKSITVFSSEGTGLKKAIAIKSDHKTTHGRIKENLKRLTFNKTINVEEFIDNIRPHSVVLHVQKIILPAPLRFLELYCPSALQIRWSRNENSREENDLKLCSSEESHVIDTGGDFETILKEVNKVVCQPVSDHQKFGPRILAFGAQKLGKSTLIQYLMNSFLNKYSVVYFLDTDSGQTEYTPPGVISLVQVTKPLLGPTFSHQKQPLKMIYLGSLSPDASPRLYEESVNRLMKYFNENFPQEILFVNTMGWIQGLGAECLQNVRDFVNPTIEIELVSSDPELSLTQEIVGNEITHFKVPSKAPTRESGASSYNAKELRKFNLIAYLGQCQKVYMPVSLINSFHPVSVSWDKIALYVMGKKVPPHRLVEAMHCSIVGLCHVVPSFMLKSDNPDFPMTLVDEPVCECLGFGLVRASDEVNHLFYIVTPLTLDQLKNVNALIKGSVMVPDEFLLKQTILNIPLPFTDQSESVKTPARKAIVKRAHFRNKTPIKKQ